MVAALQRSFAGEGSGRGLDLTIFSSSWKDRLRVGQDLDGVKSVDLRAPVALLNFAWHRFGRPGIEALTGSTFDVVHSLHPLLLPAAGAAQVVTIHDLSFLSHPERTVREIRRDYPTLAREHAQRADHIVVNSHHTAGQVEREFGVPSTKIAVCSPGAPPWPPRRQPPADGYILFVGTLEPRKNVGALLDAYEKLLDRQSGMAPSFPELVLAGSAGDESRPWMERIEQAPLAGRVRHLGYVEAGMRQALYEGARMLVQPSFEEGFGIPVLEAMTVGVPVVASSGGALPEVLGGAGLLVDPEAPTEIADAIARLLDSPALAASCTANGLERARHYSWTTMAAGVYEAYRKAVERRAGAAGSN